MTPAPVASPTWSVVIVCMDQVERLETCLRSFEQHEASTSLEIWVVAYRFSPEHLAWLRSTFPAVHVVENNQCSGFAENNNLALRQARGRYCLLFNDDAWLNMPILDALEKVFIDHPRAAIAMPQLRNPDGSVQFSGASPYTLARQIRRDFIGAWQSFGEARSKWVQPSGIFPTAGVLGAALAVRSDVAKELGYLDEQFFFSPEDTAFCVAAARHGYECYVDADIYAYHKKSSTLKANFIPCMAALQRGQILFFSQQPHAWPFGIQLAYWFRNGLKLLAWCFRSGERAREHRKIWRAMLGCTFSKKSPKDLFVHFSGKRTEA